MLLAMKLVTGIDRTHVDKTSRLLCKTIPFTNFLAKSLHLSLPTLNAAGLKTFHRGAAEDGEPMIRPFVAFV